MEKSPLQIPELAIIILAHLDASTILSLRLVSSTLNTLILTYQKSITLSVASHLSPIPIIPLDPPAIAHLQSNFHLKTLTRLPKAYELARRANKRNYDCHFEERCLRRRGITKRRTEIIVLKPTASYPLFIARCAGAILTIWILNDIRQYIDQVKPSPVYIPPPLHRQRKFLGLFPLIKNLTSRPYTGSFTPGDANYQAHIDWVRDLHPPHRTASTSHTNAYLSTLPRSHRIDLLWVLQHLRTAFPGFLSHFESLFALQQNANIILSWTSLDRRERAWAQSMSIACQVTYLEGGFEAWERGWPFGAKDAELQEEAVKAKGILTRGDWRHMEVA